VFEIQVSKYEFTTPKVEKEFDDLSIQVYSPEMIAVEKLRAICQQMDEYRPGTNKTARARDFYDICVTTDANNIDWRGSTSLNLVRDVFDAKDVPTELLANLDAYREMHRLDWPAVEIAVAEKLEGFDHYFERVKIIATVILETLRNK
jgi:predicted nucleotidyltransferase component of viral defense system